MIQSNPFTIRHKLWGASLLLFLAAPLSFWSATSLSSTSSSKNSPSVSPVNPPSSAGCSLVSMTNGDDEPGISVLRSLAGMEWPLAIDPNNPEGILPGGTWKSTFGSFIKGNVYRVPLKIPPTGIDHVTYTDPSNNTLSMTVRVVPNPEIPGSDETPRLDFPLPTPDVEPPTDEELLENLEDYVGLELPVEDLEGEEWTIFTDKDRPLPEEEEEVECEDLFDLAAAGAGGYSYQVPSVDKDGKPAKGMLIVPPDPLDELDPAKRPKKCTVKPIRPETCRGPFSVRSDPPYYAFIATNEVRSVASINFIRDAILNWIGRYAWVRALFQGRDLNFIMMRKYEIRYEFYEDFFRCVNGQPVLHARLYRWRTRIIWMFEDQALGALFNWPIYWIRSGFPWREDSQFVQP